MNVIDTKSKRIWENDNWEKEENARYTTKKRFCGGHIHEWGWIKTDGRRQFVRFDGNGKPIFVSYCIILYIFSIRVPIRHIAPQKMDEYV